MLSPELPLAEPKFIVPLHEDILCIPDASGRLLSQEELATSLARAVADNLRSTSPFSLHPAMRKLEDAVVASWTVIRKGDFTPTLDDLLVQGALATDRITALAMTPKSMDAILEKEATLRARAECLQGYQRKALSPPANDTCPDMRLLAQESGPSLGRHPPPWLRRAMLKSLVAPGA